LVHELLLRRLTLRIVHSSLLGKEEEFLGQLGVQYGQLLNRRLQESLDLSHELGLLLEVLVVLLGDIVEGRNLGVEVSRHLYGERNLIVRRWFKKKIYK